MKKVNNNHSKEELLPEYDFKGKTGTRGKYAKALQKGYSIRVLNEDGTVTVQHFIPKENAVVLEPDVKEFFPDSESVNHALRTLIALIPAKSKKQIAEKKPKYKTK